MLSRLFTAVLLAAGHTVAALSADAATFESRVRAGRDDVEERSSGSIAPASSDLEMVTDGAYQQVVGIRWEGVAVPPGASVTRAYLQFTADKQASSVTTGLILHGQAAGDAAPFSSATRNVSSRTKTAAVVAWSPPSWARGAAGAAQRVDVTPVVQEIVRRNDWASGNAVAFIITGSGHRNARSYDGSDDKAPPAPCERQLRSTRCITRSPAKHR